MATCYLKSGSGTPNTGTYRGVWTASTAFAVGDRVVGVAASNWFVYECTTGGTSGGTEPTWVNTPGSTTADNTVTWTTRAPTTWANATMTVKRAFDSAAAGDTIYVSHNHAEVNSGQQTVTSAGTIDTPVYYFCVDDTSGEPPTTLANTASHSITAASNWTINGCIYGYGSIFKSGTSTAAAASIFLDSVNNTTATVQEWEDCEFWISTTGTNGNLYCGVASASSVNKTIRWRNCRVRFAHQAHAMTIRQATFLWDGGGVVSGSSTPVSNMLLAAINADAFVTGVDFTNFSSSLVLTSNVDSGNVIFRDCKLPASWSGSVMSGNATVKAGSFAAIMNSDSADTNYRLLAVTEYGTISHELTLVRTGGATDGTTPISWKMVSSSRCVYPHQVQRSGEFVVWNDAVGSSKTLTVEILHDSATALTDAEVWVEVVQLGTSGFPLGVWVNDRKALLGTAADQTTSSATWTTTGMTNPNKQKLEVTFTPQEKGYIHVRVCLAKASKTIYVCPKPTIT